MQLSLEFSPIVIRMRRQLVTAAETYFERSGFRVELRDPSGAVGLGEAMPLEAFRTEGLATVAERLAGCAEALGTRALPEDVGGITALLGSLPLGGAPASRHAVECALLDLLAQWRGVSIAALLGPASPSVRVNALLLEREPARLAEEAEAAARAGYPVLKIKVGGPLETDVRRLEAVRRTAGGDVGLRIDSNGGWTREAAAAAIDALVPFGLELCEQPAAPDDLGAFGWLRWRGVRIAADESMAIQGAPGRLIASKGVDALVLKPMVLGGLLPCLSIAEQARAAGVGCYVTSAIEGPVGRLAAVHLAAAVGSQLPHGLAVGPLLEPAPGEELLVPVRGSIAVPSAPGLGWHSSSRGASA